MTRNSTKLDETRRNSKNPILVQVDVVVLAVPDLNIRTIVEASALHIHALRGVTFEIDQVPFFIVAPALGRKAVALAEPKYGPCSVQKS